MDLFEPSASSGTADLPTSYHYRNDPVAVAQPLPPLRGSRRTGHPTEFQFAAAE